MTVTYASNASRYLEELEERAGPFPPEIARLDGVNTWGTVHCDYRRRMVASVERSRLTHDAESLALAYSILNRSDLSPEQKAFITAITFLHDTNTSAVIPHIDRTRDAREVLADQITGQGYFRGSELPGWVQRAFNCNPERVGEEVYKGDESEPYTTAQAIENVEHIMSDSIEEIPESVMREVANRTLIKPDGSILIPEDIRADGRAISSVLDTSRTNVLTAYKRAEAVYFEGLLRDMMLRSIETQGDPTSIYTMDDAQWHTRLSGIHDLTSEEKDALQAFRYKGIPPKVGVPHNYFFNYIVMEPTNDGPNDAYESFRQSLSQRTSDLGTQIFGDRGITVVPTVVRIKPEGIQVNGIRFPRVEQASLGVYRQPDRRPRGITRDYIEKQLTFEPYFKPFMEELSKKESEVGELTK